MKKHIIWLIVVIVVAFAIVGYYRTKEVQNPLPNHQNQVSQLDKKDKQ